jgi:hypothetical protein
VAATLAREFGEVHAVINNAKKGEERRYNPGFFGGS